jgi:hypothetical protein
MISKLADDYEPLDQYHSQPRKLKIIHVGAGASGLLLAYKAERQLRNYSLICYEKYVGLPSYMTNGRAAEKAQS